MAGLWNTWTDKETGELHESYTMLTLNADNHPLMRCKNRQDPKFGPDEQDKRGVIAIEQSDVDRWLAGTVQEAQALLQPSPIELFESSPSNPSVPTLIWSRARSLTTIGFTPAFAHWMRLRLSRLSTHRPPSLQIKGLQRLAVLASRPDIRA